MTTREARWRAFAEWLMEVSALLAVFPALDMILGELRGDTTIDGWLVAGFLFAALLCFANGLRLTRGDEWNPE